MILTSLRIEGFGRLTDRAFTFAPGLNVVVGPNEAGKSTLAAAIVASLYGLGRGEKERRRPWAGSHYGTSLAYTLADGTAWQVVRAFDRDGKGVRVYDSYGQDAAARVGDGTSLVPGEAHLRVPLEVFVQTACVRQASIGFDGDTAGAVSTALAQALDGGPKEDAAIGAIERLDAALRKHVGTQRAHKNAPLRKLRDDEDDGRREVDAARATLEALAELRERIAGARAERTRAAAASAELDRRARALRATHLRSRIDALRDYRDELAALQIARANYDDVARFDADGVGELEAAYDGWRSADAAAAAAQRALDDERFDDEQRAELAARRLDAGSLDDAAYDALRDAAAQAAAAHARSAAAGSDAAAARRDDSGGSGVMAGALVAAAATATLADAAVAIAHLWLWTAAATVVALLLGFAAGSRARASSLRRRIADAKQRIADRALADERRDAAVVAGVLERLGITSLEELARRRERFLALTERERAYRACEERAHLAAETARLEAQRFDACADALVPDVLAARDERRAVARTRAARRRKRDGLEASLAMLTVRRADILHGDDEFALRAEFDALLAAGVEPSLDADPATSLRALERERDELRALEHAANLRLHSLEGELRAGEERVPDLAALDESLAATRSHIAQLEAFERAVALARTTIERHKDEAHRAFARRLETYSADVLAAITGGRYAEIHLAPATLALSVRVPETGVLEPLAILSAGTRDQVALVVRFAAARMFAEGLETPPLLLDDPFAFWDAGRIARCLPVLVRGARDGQTIVFTAESALADAAVAAGAHRIELDAAAVPG